MINKKIAGIISIVFVMLIWGSSFAITKVLFNEITPMLLASFRFIVATLFLLPVLLLSKKIKAIRQLTLRDLFFISLMGLSGVALYYTCFNFSLLYTSASSGALIQGFMPIYIAVFGVVFLKEKLSRLQIGGIILSFSGVLMIAFLAAPATDINSFKGNLLMILAGLCWTVYTILSRKLKHIPSLIVTCLSTFTGTILLLPVAALELNAHPDAIQLSFNGWMAIIYLGAISSALCYFLYNRALETLPAAQVGNFLNLDPIIGVIIALIFLKEHINEWQIIGMLLVLTGILMSTKKSLHKIKN